MNIIRKSQKDNVIGYCLIDTCPGNTGRKGVDVVACGKYVKNGRTTKPIEITVQSK
ncbi:MAG: hypothetical protein ACI4WR_00330 [Bulleidia sp.]